MRNIRRALGSVQNFCGAVADWANRVDNDYKTLNTWSEETVTAMADIQEQVTQEGNRSKFLGNTMGKMRTEMAGLPNILNMMVNQAGSAQQMTEHEKMRQDKMTTMDPKEKNKEQQEAAELAEIDRILGSSPSKAARKKKKKKEIEKAKGEKKDREDTKKRKGHDGEDQAGQWGHDKYRRFLSTYETFTPNLMISVPCRHKCSAG
eukprot:s1579_g17.t1